MSSLQAPRRIVSLTLLVFLLWAPGSAVGIVSCGPGSPPATADNDDEDNQNDDTDNDGEDDDDNDLEPTPVDNACADDEQLCGDECIDTDVDPFHCGECGEACPDAQLCENGECVSHGGDCPAEECSGFTYCEGDTGLCRRGCYEDGQCTGGRICDTDTNSCVCPEGQRLCGGACFESDSPDACGADCLACPDGAGTGEPMCVEGQCELSCDNDQLVCDNRCADCPDGADEVECDGAACAATSCEDDGQRACQGDCVDCPEAEDTACDGDQCIADTCPDGQLPCGGECVDCPVDADEHACEGDVCIAVSCSADDQRACGGDCVDCPDGADEHTCEGAQCIATFCSADDQRACGDDCVDCPDGADEHTCEGAQCIATSCSADDQRACGDDCVDCPDGADEHTCDGNQCIAVSCIDDDSLVCDGICASCPTDGAGEPGCDGDQCVMSPCTDGFECPDSGCCSWDVELIDDDLLTPRFAPVFVRDGTAYSFVTTTSNSSVYGTQSGDDWSLQTAEMGSPTGGTGNRPPAVSFDGQKPLVYFLPGGEDTVHAADPTSPGDHGTADDVTDEWTSAIAAGADDDGHYLLYPSVDDELTIARETGSVGGDDWFTADVIDSDIGSISHLDTVVDDDGDIHTVVVSTAGGSNLIHATNDSGSWQTEPITSSASSSLVNMTRTASITIDEHPVIAHATSEWSSPDELNLQEFDGADWQQTTGIDEGDDIREITVEIDAAGNPHILYRMDEAVHHAWRFDGQWSTSTIDPVLDDEDAMVALYLHDDSLQALVVVDRDELHHLQPTAN